MPISRRAIRAFRRRVPWLSVNLFGGIVAALLISLFERTLQGAVALALFIPVVLNLAESVSSQSVSLTLHLMRGQGLSWGAVLPKLRSELLAGVFLGSACGAAVGLVALIWLRRGAVALALLGGIAAGVAASAVFGMAIPILLRVARLDPRVAAGPIALAMADIVTILCYFALASLLLG